MLRQILSTIIFMYVSVISITAIATETLVKQNDKEGRSYHSFIYKTDQCETCHGKGQALTFPDDKACTQCHNIDALAEQTKRPEEDKWQNPHNNLHYGKEVPCQDCHGEHVSKKPICSNCHNFNFDRFKSN